MAQEPQIEIACLHGGKACFSFRRRAPHVADAVPKVAANYMPVLEVLRAAGWFGKGTTVRNSSGKGSRRGSGGQAASPAGRNAASGRATGKLPPPQSAARQEVMPNLPGYRQQAELEAGLRTGTFRHLPSSLDSEATASATIPILTACVALDYDLDRLASRRALLQGQAPV